MIINSLREKLISLGIQKGDTLYVTSDIGLLGIPDEIKEEIKKKGSKYLLQSYIDTLLDVLGKNGNLLMPTFTYSACKNEIYDPKVTKSTVGSLTEYFRQLEGVSRTHHTIFSCAFFGPSSDDFLKTNDLDAFGKGTIFDYLYEKNAKYLLLGLNMIKGSTYVYYSEQKYNVRYRYFKTFQGKIKLDGSSIQENEVRYFVRDYSYDYRDDWAQLEADSIAEGVTKKDTYNGHPLLVHHAKEIDNFIGPKLLQDESYLINIKL